MKNFITWFLCYLANLALFGGVEYLFDIFVFDNATFDSGDILLNLFTSLIFSIGTFFWILEIREKKQKEKNKQLA